MAEEECTRLQRAAEAVVRRAVRHGGVNAARDLQQRLRGTGPLLRSADDGGICAGQAPVDRGKAQPGEPERSRGRMLTDAVVPKYAAMIGQDQCSSNVDAFC